MPAVAEPTPAASPVLTTAALFHPITLRGVTARNRIAVSPMCMYSAADGMATDWHLVHLASRAVGGAGIVMTEATAVTANGRISPGDLGLWHDAQVEPLARIAAAISANGAVPAIQLAHAGRKAGSARPWEGGRQLSLDGGGWQAVAPSAVPFHDSDRPPVALDADGIDAVIEAFAAAARRAITAGFRIIEIHAAHGYLLHEFLSPLSNHRSDAYGGSFTNRIRLLCEVSRAVRDVMPSDAALFVRLSATDWAIGGWSPDDTVAVSEILSSHGVDLIDCSSGGLVRTQQIVDGPGYQVPFAARVRREAGIPSGAVGRITTPTQAESILARGDADLVLLARASLRDPYWPIHAAQALGATAPWPVQYVRAES